MRPNGFHFLKTLSVGLLFSIDCCEA